MPDALFLDIFYLVVIASILSAFVGAFLIHIFYMKVQDAEANAREDQKAGDPDTKYVDHFGTSPVGIPPSLARD